MSGTREVPERNFNNFPRQRKAETAKNKQGRAGDLGDPSPGIREALLNAGELLYDGVEECELLVPEVEVVDDGAEDVDDAARFGAEEVAEREAPEVDGLEDVPRPPVNAPKAYGAHVELRVVELLQQVEP
jgi:hypothetical protein